MKTQAVIPDSTVNGIKHMDSSTKINYVILKAFATSDFKNPLFTAKAMKIRLDNVSVTKNSIKNRSKIQDREYCLI